MIMQEDLDQNTSQEENTETQTTQESEAPAAAATDESAEERVPHRKVRTGVVVSNNMDKSILVKVTRRVRHPLYKKYHFKSKNFMAHDENNDCNEGDTVRIIETRPMSKRKRWALEEIIERAK